MFGSEGVSLEKVDWIFFLREFSWIFNTCPAWDERSRMRNFWQISVFVYSLFCVLPLFSQVKGLRADSPEAIRKFNQLQLESFQYQMRIAPPAKIGYRENISWGTEPGRDSPDDIEVGDQEYRLGNLTARVEKIAGSRLCLLQFNGSGVLFYLRGYSTKEMHEGMCVTLVGPIECVGIKDGYRVLEFISPSEMRRRAQKAR